MYGANETSRLVTRPIARVTNDLHALEGELWGDEGLAAATQAVIHEVLVAGRSNKLVKWAGTTSHETSDGAIQLQLFERSRHDKDSSPTLDAVNTPCGTVEFRTQAILKAKTGLETLYPVLQGDVAELQKVVKDQRRQVILLEGHDSPNASQASALQEKRTELEDHEKVLSAGTAALAGYKGYLKSAATVESVGRRLMTATEDKCLSDGIESVSLAKSVDLQVSIKSADLDTGVAAEVLPETTLKTTLRPDWLFRPAVGLSLLKAPSAKFATYVAKEVPKEAGGGFRVAEGDAQDNRIDWGLMLSLAPRWLDWRDATGFAVYAPTFVVNPSEKVRSFGVGAGVSWKILKLDAGWLWTKHVMLDRLNIDDPLAAKEDLRTVETYGRSRFYVGLSLVGWAPFKSGS